MRRIVVITCALAAFTGAALAHAAGGPVARLAGCDVTPPDRSADFYGHMEAVPGASRMAMRFVVFERLGKSGDWSKVDLPVLRDWQRSGPGVRTFGYRQTVDRLRPGGAYKARIVYRWTDAAGNVVQTDSKETPVCRGPLPNLLISDLSVRKGPTDDTRTYRVTIENNGRAAADGINVTVTVDKALLDTARVKVLDVGSTRTVTFTGPPCNHGVRVKIDPENVIGELLEGDNSQLFGCPA